MNTPMTLIQIRAPKEIPSLVKRVSRSTRITNESEVIRQALFLGLPELERRMSASANSTPAPAAK